MISEYKSGLFPGVPVAVLRSRGGHREASEVEVKQSRKGEKMKKLIVIVLCFMLLALPVRSYAFCCFPNCIKAIPKLTLAGSEFSGPAAIAGAGFVGLILILTVPNMKAWDEAKNNHTEAAFQKRQCFPQGFFAKLLGGDNYSGPSIP